MNAPATDRARAARLLLAVLVQRKTTDQAFGRRPEHSPSPLVQELVMGSLRYFYSLNEELELLLEKDLRSKDLDLRYLMLVGAYQLAYMRIPAHAAINETVNACRPLRKPWARGLVNAVLRKFAARLEDYLALSLADRSFELPHWIEAQLRNACGDDAESVMAGLLERAPMSLRINFGRIDADAYRKLLDTAGIDHRPGDFPEQIFVETPLPVARLPGFAEGLVSVQDGGAMLAAHLLAPSSLQPSGPRRILDACAAPGGKLFHLAEAWPKSALVGLEISDSRLEHLASEARRLGHHEVSLCKADATRLDWWDGEAFDSVLLDAPCSGVGTLRRHPDIKHLRQPEDIAEYQQLQLKLLRNLWRVVAPTGNLLYCTCSLFKEENDNVVQQFLDETRDAELQSITAPDGRATASGWQLLPLAHPPHPATAPGISAAGSARSDSAGRADGFFYSLLSKKPV